MVDQAAVAQLNNSELPGAQRMILWNLIMLFALVAAVIATIFYRQHLQEQHSQLIDEQFQISRHIAKLSQYHLQLQQWLLFNHHHPAEPSTSPVVYGDLRQAITAEVSRLQETLRMTQATQSDSAQIVRYIDRWHTLDRLLAQEITPPYDEDQLLQLSDYLQEMNDTTVTLLAPINQRIAATQQRWHRRTRFLSVFLVALLTVLLLLTAWTFYGVWRFIQIYRATAAALQAGERRHLALLETIPDVVLRRTRDGIYTDYKPAKTFGQFMPRANFIGKHVNDILPPAVAKLSTDMAARALDTGQEQSYEYRIPNRITGIMTDYEARIYPCGEDEVQVIVRDVSEEKVQTERQQQAQKLESLGILAGGIAHDFNNLLTSMMAQISLAKARLTQAQAPFAQLDKALIATERAADLTRQLLAYAGKGRTQVTALDLNQLIRDNSGLLETALPNRAELQIALAENLPWIEADRGHIQQVVMNIAINAAEALRQESDTSQEQLTQLPAQTAHQSTEPVQYVRITTTVEWIATAPLAAAGSSKTLPPGLYVVLQIQDNGCGMDEATKQRIFDPFFSTKAKGHGLGLAATVGIVHSYHGAIRVESDPGVGSCFTLLFPASHQPREVPMDTAHHPPAIYGSAPTVLVIDDEAPIREVVTDILQAEGFTIAQAANGHDGVAQLRQHGGAVDLVLLDMKMPGLSGDETLQLLHEIDPTLKVILSSGYTESEVGAHLRNAQVMAYLAKPYSVDQLTRTIHDALAAPATPHRRDLSVAKVKL